MINGVGSESLQPYVEAVINMVAGMAIGFYFCWQESLVCLIVSPILIVGNALEMQMSSGLTEENNEG